MASSRLTWVHRRPNRAKDVPKDLIDEYKSVIRHLYLDQNMTRLEVISRLKNDHGLTITASQFSKATNRWGLYKQPRHAQDLAQALEATIEPEPEPPGALFNIEVDALDADNENKFLFQVFPNPPAPDSDTAKSTENNGPSSTTDFSDQNDHSTRPPQRRPGSDEYPGNEPPRKTGDPLLGDDTTMWAHQDLSSEINIPIHISGAPEAQDPSTSRCCTPRALGHRQTLVTHSTMAELCPDYLACCYLFQDFFNCVEEIIRIDSNSLTDESIIHQFLDLMRIAKSSRMGTSAIDLLRDFKLLEAAQGDADQTSALLNISTQDRMLFHAYLSGIYALLQCPEIEAQRHLDRVRQIRNDLVASPSCSLGMWSILFLQRESSHGDIPDNLVSRLDIDDEEFLCSFQTSLSLCKQSLELVEEGVSNHGLVQFDSLFLQKHDATILQDICRLMQKNSRLDTWQEAGFLFAFVWGNAQQETSISSSWQKQIRISDITSTHFLAIVCRMIVHQTTLSYPDLEKIDTHHFTDDLISSLYLDTIEDLMTARRSPQHLKRDFLRHFTKHHIWSELEPEDNQSIKRVQNYQKSVLDEVVRHNIDSAKEHSSIQEISHEATNARMTQSLSLGSNKSDDSPPGSTSSSHDRQRYLSSISSNPTMTRSPASGSSQGSSLNSFRRFQAASTAITIRLREYRG